ncbi:MAG: DNA-directed RNA polymerase subunit K [Candidatus Methanospirareceae archaeon]
MTDKQKQEKRIKKEQYTKYEKARIIGARALQIAMGAPVLIETDGIDPIEIAIQEFELDVVPITVKRTED